MDPIFDALRHCASSASSTVTHALTRGPGASDDAEDRAALVLASDVEASCLAIAGLPAARVAAAALREPASEDRAPRAGGGVLSSMLAPLRRLGGGLRAGAGVGGASGAAGTAAVAGGATGRAADGDGGVGGGGVVVVGGGGDSGSIGASGGVVSGSSVLEHDSRVTRAAGTAASAALALALPAPLPPTSAHVTPITDIVILHGDDAPPPGYARISDSVSGMYSADLNAAGGTRQLWLAVARASGGVMPITNLVLVSLNTGEFLPPGFVPVRRAVSGVIGKTANLKYGLSDGGKGGGEKNGADAELLLCVSRGLGAPIVEVGVAFPAGAITIAGLLTTKKPAAALPLAPPRDAAAPLGGPHGTVARRAATATDADRDKGVAAMLSNFANKIASDVQVRQGVL
jgi:hypothetical protein